MQSMDVFSVHVEGIRAGKSLSSSKALELIKEVIDQDLPFDPLNAVDVLLFCTPPLTNSEIRSVLQLLEKAQVESKTTSLLHKIVSEKLLKKLIERELMLAKRRKHIEQRAREFFAETISMQKVIEFLQLCVREKTALPFTTLRSVVESLMGRDIDLYDLNSLLILCQQGFVATGDEEYLQLGGYISQEASKHS